MSNLFVDMDGTLCEWRSAARLEELYEEGYFLKLTPHNTVVEAIRILVNKGEHQIYILSAVLFDSPYAEQEKREWLKKYLPMIDEEHLLFCRYGSLKSDLVAERLKRPLTEKDYLLDDYSKNLHEWKAAGGTGVKLRNGINGTKGSWQDMDLVYDSKKEGMTETLAMASALERILK